MIVIIFCVDYHRKSIRLNKNDYTKQNLYFVTIGSYKHAHFWGEIKNNEFILSGVGKIIDNNLNLLSKKFDIKIGDYQIMPNHLHLVLEINCRGVIHHAQNNKIDILRTCKHMGLMNQTPTLGQMIRFFKAKSTYEINKSGGISPPLFKENWNYLCGRHVFQRNYYEHIIRNEEEYLKIKEYIKLNPEIWFRDRNKKVGV